MSFVNVPLWCLDMQLAGTPRCQDHANGRPSCLHLCLLSPGSSARVLNAAVQDSKPCMQQAIRNVCCTRHKNLTTYEYIMNRREQACDFSTCACRFSSLLGWHGNPRKQDAGTSKFRGLPRCMDEALAKLMLVRR